MHKLSEKYAELLRRHNKLNGEIRKCFYNTANFYDFINARESSVVEHSKAMRIYENEDDNKSDAYSSQEISPVATQSSIDHQNSVIESNSNTNLATNIMLVEFKSNSIICFNKSQFFISSQSLITIVRYRFSKQKIP